MVYGIVSQLDDVTTKELFRSKKIAEDKIAHITQLSSLMSVLRTGDVVHVVNVNRFASVAQFVTFGKFCMSEGVSLCILSQPYLDLGKGKQWKPAMMKLMRQMVETERRALAGMTRAFKMTNEQWDIVWRCFEIMSLEELASVFAVDGILKRGS